MIFCLIGARRPARPSPAESPPTLFSLDLRTFVDLNTTRGQARVIRLRFLALLKIGRHRVDSRRAHDQTRVDTRRRKLRFRFLAVLRMASCASLFDCTVSGWLGRVARKVAKSVHSRAFKLRKASASHAAHAP